MTAFERPRAHNHFAACSVHSLRTNYRIQGHPVREEDEMTIHVTETQKFLVRSALEVSGADERLLDQNLIDDVIRAMLVVESAGMQAYMLRGSDWSHRSRYWQDPAKAEQERADLLLCRERFEAYIDQARGQAASRIRANRKRRIREMVQKAQHLQRYAGQQLRELEQRRRGVFNPDAANWDEAPRQLPVGHPGEDAA